MSIVISKGTQRLASTFRTLPGYRYHLTCINSSTIQLVSQRNVELVPVTGHPFSSHSWRKDQLEKLEQRLRPNKDSNTSDDILLIERDEDVQPMWKAMESRVIKRKSLTVEQLGAAKVGRRNIRLTDEDTWLEAGLYSGGNSSSDSTENK